MTVPIVATKHRTVKSAFTVHFAAKHPHVRKVICTDCQLPVDVFLGKSLLPSNCQRCGKAIAQGICVQEKDDHIDFRWEGSNVIKRSPSDNGGMIKKGVVVK
jgi:hypothetical protein